MNIIEKNVISRYRVTVSRCIIDPGVISYMSAILTVDESSRLHRLFCDSPERCIEELINLIQKSEKAGKWQAFVDALRKANYPYLADLIEGKDSCKTNHEYERKMMQIFSPTLEKRLMVFDIMTELYACEVISDIDKDEVVATCERKGNAYATIVLLDRIQCRKSPKEWYSKFLNILSRNGYADIAKEIEPDFKYDDPDVLIEKDAGDFCNSEMEYEESAIKENIMTDCEEPPMSVSDLQPQPVRSIQSSYPASVKFETKAMRFEYDCSPSKRPKLKEESSFDSDETDSLTSENGDIPEGTSTLQLRKYQLELAERAKHGENTIICAPTGSGKTWVALHVAEKHLQTFTNRPVRKIVFLAKTGALIKQQADKFNQYLTQFETKLLQGDMEEAGMLGELIDHHDIICMTPQILVNNLESGSMKSLTQVSLIILDECHHTRGDDPYSVLMRKYLVEKYDSTSTRDEKLPQIVGLTASIGIGKSSTDIDARDYILRVCALMDVKRLSIVQNHKEELQKYTSQPEEDVIKMSQIENDPGRTILLDAINDTEKKLKSMAFFQPSLIEVVQRKCPRNKESQEYNKWTVDVISIAQQKIPDPDTSRNIRSCAVHLNVYNQALEVNCLLQKMDVMKFLAEKHTIAAQQMQKLTEFEKDLFKTLNDVQSKMAEVEMKHENPNVRNISDIISNLLNHGDADPRAMVFVQARATCRALADFLDSDLKDFQVRPLFGKDNRGNEEGMTPAEQTKTLQLFRDGEYRVLVATSIGEEGIDIPECNMVLNYNCTGNEITKIQMKGRIRKHTGRHIVIGDAKMIQREKINVYKESMMQRGMKLFNDLSVVDIERKIYLIQKEEIRKFKQKKEHENAKKQQQTRTGDYEIQCKGCSEFVCYLSNIRKSGTHRFVCDATFSDRTELREFRPPANFDGFISNYKVFGKKCPVQWGVRARRNGVDNYLLTCKNMKFINRENDKIESFKSWQDIPVVIPDL